VVCLSDSSKVGTEAAIRFASLDEVDVLVTDAGIRPAERDAFEEVGVEVVVA
jgi:DeoR family fructose operon transcriptional repressor